MVWAKTILVATILLVLSPCPSTAEQQYLTSIVNQEINATANRTQLTSFICEFNRLCMHTENTTVLNQETDGDDEADGMADENEDSRRQNSTGYFYVARVTQKVTQKITDTVSNGTSIVSNLNLTCKSMPNTSIIILAGSLNVSSENLINKVIGNISCQNFDSINTTDFQDTGKAEAKPFLKVLYISTQLFVYMLVSACFGL